MELLVSYWICAVQKFLEATENINSNFLVYIWYTERVYHIHHSFIRSTQIHSKHPLRISFQHLGNPVVPCLVIIVISVVTTHYSKASNGGSTCRWDFVLISRGLLRIDVEICSWATGVSCVFLLLFSCWLNQKFLGYLKFFDYNICKGT